MKEKLIIRNFGPIKSAELELSRFNVFIGEQGTGKSTVAKVLAVCRYFSYIISPEVQGVNSYQENNFSEGLVSWGLNESTTKDTFIQYNSKHYTFTVQCNQYKRESDFNGEIEKEEYLYLDTKLEPISDEFKGLLNELIRIKPPTFPDGKLTTRNIGWTIPYSFFQNDVSEVMDNPYYVFTERGLQSIFSLGKNSIQNLSDALYNQFANLDQVARLFKEDTLIEPLGLVYKNVDGRGYIRKVNEDTFYSLYNAASGYQSTIPVVLLMKYYISIRKKAKTFIIEEPELNLFPSAQKELMQYLVDKTMNYGNTMLLTTHSPYVLTSLNNLIYAYQTGQTHKEKVNEIIEEKYWLNPKEVSVYRLLGDGTCENIVAEEGLIEADKIDEVSRTINESFDALLDIELGTENETVSNG